MQLFFEIAKYNFGIGIKVNSKIYIFTILKSKKEFQKNLTKIVKRGGVFYKGEKR